MWHLTCAFFGDVTDERIPRLAERLGRAAARHESAVVRFAGAGAFSRPARATVFYAGIAAADNGPLTTLAALADSCAAAGRRVGLLMEDRKFRPHITLARAKGRTPVDMRPLVAALAGYEGSSWTASEIVLLQSHLGADARYETLANWPLRAAAPHQA
jgi:2'-5' RNA ligase